MMFDLGLLSLLLAGVLAQNPKDASRRRKYVWGLLCISGMGFLFVSLLVAGWRWLP